MTTEPVGRQAPPELAEPPEPTGAWAWIQPYVRPSFRILNRWFMIPLHRAGLGAWLETPLMGYMLLLRVRGRKSGLVRETPLSYLVAEGAVWVVAGFGPRTEWFRNLQVEPAVEAWLPGRRLRATAVEIRDPAIRARILPRLVRATGLPGFTIGCNPFTAPEERILAAVDWVPLVRIGVEGEFLEPGPDDPGGTAWIWRQGLLLVAGLLAMRLLRRRR